MKKKAIYSRQHCTQRMCKKRVHNKDSQGPELPYSLPAEKKERVHTELKTFDF